VAHANAVLTPVGRRLLVDRVLSGRAQSHVAKELGVSLPMCPPVGFAIPK
jgi:hypothetical protein